MTEIVNMATVAKYLCDPNAFNEYQQRWFRAAPTSAWSVATNGQASVAVMEGQATPLDSGLDLTEKLLLPADMVPVATCKIGDIRKWTGRPKTLECDTCGGHGRVDCDCPKCPDDDHPCPECDGSGRDGYTYDIRNVLGIGFNATLIARAVIGINSNLDVNVGIHDDGYIGKRLILWNDNLCVLVMSYRDNGTAAKCDGIPWEQVLVNVDGGEV